MFTLKVDHREQGLKALHDKYQDLPIIWENLSMGDVLIEYQDPKNKMLMIMERKTLCDLAASIKDGRYAQQKQRLLEQNCKLFYILEDTYDLSYKESSGSKVINGIYHKALVGAIINMIIRDDIHILFTGSLEETYALLKNIFNRLTADPDKYLMGMTVCHKPAPKSIKADAPKEDCYLAQLCQIPGVSIKTAKAISTKYTTMCQLCMAIHEHGDACLKGLLTIDGNDKKRHVSNNVIQNIVTYLGA